MSRMKSRKIEINANAKINLFLEVGLRRADGYHDIESVMQAVTLCDKVTVEAGDGVGRGIALECDGLPTDRGNIAYRAAELFCRAAGIEPHVKIHIEKRIPVAAGLAGGSTDGAAVLYALNAIYDGVLDGKKLHALAARLGADVPFCLDGGTALARGIGEQLSECPVLPDCHILIAKRSEGVLTPEAFRELDRSREGVRYTGRSAHACRITHRRYLRNRQRAVQCLRYSSVCFAPRRGCYCRDLSRSRWIPASQRQRPLGICAV